MAAVVCEEEFDSSSSDEEEILLLLLLMRRRRRRLRASHRKVWTKRWISRRQTQGACANIVRELNVEDPEQFRQFHRLDKDVLTHSISNNTTSRHFDRFENMSQHACVFAYCKLIALHARTLGGNVHSCTKLFNMLNIRRRWHA